MKALVVTESSPAAGTGVATPPRDALRSDIASPAQKKSARHAARAFTLRLRVRGRMLLLTWRPRPQPARLVQLLLRRSLRNLSAVVLAIAGLTSVQAAASTFNGGGDVLPAVLPTNPRVAPVPSGASATFSQSGNVLTVTQTGSRAIVNWDTFSIGTGGTVNFVQPGSTAAILNRVTNGEMSSLQGALNANGKVWLINPAGIMVGNGATINVGGFVASSLTVTDNDFLASRMHFTGGAGVGLVQNYGTITTPEGGQVYLVGAGVENHGTITAPGGEVLLGAGDTVELADTGTPGVSIAVTGTAGTVTNLGNIVSEAGRIGLGGVLVANSGTLDASSVVRDGGRIFLRSTQGTSTTASSVITVDGNATAGDVAIASDQATSIDGSISAGGHSSSGGSVTVSGKSSLSMVNAPVFGQGGRFEIDASDVSIETLTSGAPAISMGNGNVIVKANALSAALSTNTNVTITSGTLASSGQAGDLSVNGAITKTGPSNATLSLNAEHDVILYQPVTSIDGSLNISLGANKSNGSDGHALVMSSIDLNAGMMNSSSALELSGATLSNLSLGVENPISITGPNATTINSSLSLNTVSLQRAGTLQGSGRLTIANLSMSDGTIKGATGDPSYDIRNLTMVGGSTNTIDGRTVNLLQGGTSDMTDATLVMNHAATLSNGGTLYVGNGTIFGRSIPGTASSTINNNGVINSSNTGNSNTRYAENFIGSALDGVNQVAFNNAGTVNVDGSRLTLAGPGIHTGAFVLGGASYGGSILGFGDRNSNSAGPSVTQTLSPGSSISVAPFNLGGEPSVWFGHPLGDDTFNLNTNVTLPFVVLDSGTLQGSGALTVTRMLAVEAGSRIKGNPGDSAYTVKSLGMDGTVIVDGRTVNLQAGGEASQVQGDFNANIILKNSATFNNAGAIYMNANGTIGAADATTGNSVFNNTGSILVGNYGASVNTVGGGFDANNKVTFNNSGSVYVEAGTLVLGGPAHSNQGNTTIAAGATLDTSGHDFINTSAGRVSGGGTVNLSGARFLNDGEVAPSYSTAGPVTLRIQGSYLQGADGTLDMGFMHGTGNGQHSVLQVTGDVHFDGTLAAQAFPDYTPAPGDSIALVTAGGSRTGAFASIDAPALLQPGYSLAAGEAFRLQYVSGDTLYFNNAGGDFRWANAANWSGGALPTAGNPVFIDTGNTSVVHASGDDNVAALTIASTNALTVSGGSLGVGGLTTNRGTLATSGSGILNLNGGLTGTGQMILNGGSVNLAGASDIASLRVNTGTYTGNGDLAATSAALYAGGVMQGSGKLSVTNFTLGGGTIAGAQGNAAYDIANLTANGFAFIDGRTVNLSGTSSLTSGLVLQHGSVLTNTGTLNLGNYGYLGYYYTGEVTGRGLNAIYNAGVINSATTLADPFGNIIGSSMDAANKTSFYNNGTVNVTRGLLQLGGDGTHTGAFHVRPDSASGARLSFGANSGNFGVQTLGAGSTVTENGDAGRPASVLIGYGTTVLDGDLSLPDLRVAGGLLRGPGNLTVTQSFQQDAGLLSFATGSVALTQASGNLQVAGIDAASVSLTAASGSIGQAGSGAGIHAASLVTHSAGSVDLVNPANRIDAYRGVNAGGGAMTIASSGAMALGPIANTGGSVIINAGGAISQTGGVDAAALRTSSVGGSMLEAANTVGRFAGQNSGSGEISLVNTSRPGALTLENSDNRAGGITVDNTGAIVVAGDLNAGNGNLALTAHSPITVDAGLYATGTITLNAVASAPGGDIITINGNVNSSTGGIVLDAGSDMMVASSAVLSVANGAPINLTADAGGVTVVDGATFLGAVPNIRQSRTTSGAPPATTPTQPTASPPTSSPPASNPEPAASPSSQPTPAGASSQEPAAASFQPTVALVEESLNTPVRPSRSSDGTATLPPPTATGAVSSDPSGQTIGGTVDSFGGPVSDPDDPRTAAEAAVTRPLPVCR